MRISHFLIPVGYGSLMVFLYSIPFGSIYHARTFIPREIVLVSIWFNGTDPNNNSGPQRFSPQLTYQISILDWYCNFDTHG